MKLTAGLGSIDNYIPFARAGVDEVFCGYVPESWSRRHGMTTPLNRREVVYVNVQIGGENELDILRKMVQVWKVPVTLTLNSLSYTPDEYPELAEYMLSCKRHGFSSFIIADPGLFIYLHKQGLSGEFTLHISGELGEMNHAMLKPLHDLSASRVILHRKVSIPDMKKIIACSKANGYSMEYEAFLLNEMCHFHGGFCNSLHCDELAHMCLVPYRLGPAKDSDVLLPEGPDSFEDKLSAAAHPEFFRDTLSSGAHPNSFEDELSPADQPIGASGCGLCSLWELRDAGVEWLKIVSRGASADQTIHDIRAARKALQILEETNSEDEYIVNTKKELFPDGCSGNCYYFSSL